MLSPSPSFLTAANATIRRPIGKLEITWTDSIIDPDITKTTAPLPENRGSVVDQVCDTISDSDYKYTILDGSWALNDDYHLAPATTIEQGQYQIGYYGNQISASSSPYVFSTDETILLEFSARAIQGVFLVGDKLLNQYPVSFDIYIRSGVTVLHTISITSNVNTENYYSGIFSNVDNIELVVHSWSHPDTCCKIVEFFTSFVATYYGDDIISIDLLEEREIRDATLPVGNISSNEINISLQNYVYGYNEWVDVGQVMTIKSDIQDVTYWAVYLIVNGGTPSLIDSYTCPSRVKGVGFEWVFVYQYTIPSYSTGTTLQLSFIPTGADSGKPGDFESDLWTINDILLDPYHPDNPISLFAPSLRPNRKIKASLGFILPSGVYEYLPVGTFWSNEWTINDNSVDISTDGRDRLGVLRDHIYDGSVLWENEALSDIADDVLTYAKANIPMPDLQWDIDISLDSIIIPYAYFDKISYFEVLEIISKACIGQCYMSKEDVLILTSFTSNEILTSYDTVLTKDDYFNIKIDNKYLEIKNKVYVNYSEYSLAVSAEIYRSENPISIAASETLDPITIEYSDPIKGGLGSIVEQTGGVSVSIIAEEYFSWGAIISCQNSVASSGTFKIAITGQTLSLTDTFTVSTQDDDSIEINNLSEYKLPNNYLIQDESTATTIAEALLATYSNPRSMIEIDYRGNPAIELADIVRATVYKRDIYNILKDYIIYKSSLSFDGTLKGMLYGRYIETVATGDLYQDSDTGSFLYQDSDTGSIEWQDTDL